MSNINRPMGGYGGATRPYSQNNLSVAEALKAIDQKNQVPDAQAYARLTQQQGRNGYTVQPQSPRSVADALAVLENNVMTPELASYTGQYREEAIRVEVEEHQIYPRMKEQVQNPAAMVSSPPVSDLKGALILMNCPTLMNHLDKESRYEAQKNATGELSLQPAAANNDKTGGGDAHGILMRSIEARISLEGLKDHVRLSHCVFEALSVICKISTYQRISGGLPLTQNACQRYLNNLPSRGTPQEQAEFKAIHSLIKLRLFSDLAKEQQFISLPMLAREQHKHKVRLQHLTVLTIPNYYQEIAGSDQMISHRDAVNAAKNATDETIRRCAEWLANPETYQTMSLPVPPILLAVLQ